jgi:hypothetical protein
LGSVCSDGATPKRSLALSFWRSDEVSSIALIIICPSFLAKM